MVEVEVVGWVRVMAEDQVERRVMGLVKELGQDLKVDFKPVKLTHRCLGKGHF